jgi:hypothetical protein
MPLSFQHFMLIFPLDTAKGIFMEWLVIDVIYLGKASRYMLILHAGTLKMMSEVTSKSSYSQAIFFTQSVMPCI